MKRTPYRIRDGYTRVTGLYAFWSYDLFPYVLGGPVMAMKSDGSIQAASYGGSCFRPIKIMPRKAGEKLFAEIRKLQAENKAAREAFDREWLAKLVKLFPEAAK